MPPAIFGNLQCHLQYQAKLTRFCTQCNVKQAIFLRSKCSVQQNYIFFFQDFKKELAFMG